MMNDLSLQLGSTAWSNTQQPQQLFRRHHSPPPPPPQLVTVVEGNERNNDRRRYDGGEGQNGHQEFEFFTPPWIEDDDARHHDDAHDDEDGNHRYDHMMTMMMSNSVDEEEEEEHHPLSSLMPFEDTTIIPTVNMDSNTTKTATVEDISRRSRCSRHLHHSRSSSSRNLSDEIQRLDNNECRLSTSMSTYYPGDIGSSGIVFTIKSTNQTIELLGFEFDYDPTLKTSKDSLDVEVYYIDKDYWVDEPQQQGILNVNEIGTKIADTTAMISPDMKYAIIPTVDITSVTMEADKIYSFFITIKHTDSTILRVTEFDATTTTNPVGTLDSTDDVISTYVGHTMQGYPKPNLYIPGGTFRGKIHYKRNDKCDNFLISTEVTLPFAVNADPTADVTQELNDAVSSTLLAYTALNPTFIKYEKFHNLKLKDTNSNFRGKSEKCPPSYDLCALLSTTLTIDHALSIDPGTLQLELLRAGTQLSEAIQSKTDFEVSYIGDPLSEMELLMVFDGIPYDSIINAVQRRYYEKTTTDFLRTKLDQGLQSLIVPGQKNVIQSTVMVFQVELIDFISEVNVIEVDDDAYNVADEIDDDFVQDMEANGGVPPTEDAGARRRYLRGRRRTPRGGFTRRSLQGNLGKMEVGAKIYGMGNLTDLSLGVKTTFELFKSGYISTLAREQLRPGEINEGNAGALFGEISDVLFNDLPPGFGQDATKPPSDGLEDGEYHVKWTYIYLSLMVLSIFWIIYMIYQDCFATTNDKFEKIQYHEGGSRHGGSMNGSMHGDRSIPLGGSGSFHSRMGDGSHHSRTLGGGSMHSRSGSFHERLGGGSNHSRPGSYHDRLGGGSAHSRTGLGGGSFHDRRPPGPSRSFHDRPGGGSFHDRRPPGKSHSFHDRPTGPGSFHDRRPPGPSRSFHDRLPNGSSHGRPPPERRAPLRSKSMEAPTGLGSMPVRRAPGPSRSFHDRLPNGSSHSRTGGPPAHGRHAGGSTHSRTLGPGSTHSRSMGPGSTHSRTMGAGSTHSRSMDQRPRPPMRTNSSHSRGPVTGAPRPPQRSKSFEKKVPVRSSSTQSMNKVGGPKPGSTHSLPTPKKAFNSNEYESSDESSSEESDIASFHSEDSDMVSLDGTPAPNKPAGKKAAGKKTKGTKSRPKQTKKPSAGAKKNAKSDESVADTINSSGRDSRTSATGQPAPKQSRLAILAAKQRRAALAERQRAEAAKLAEAAPVEEADEESSMDSNLSGDLLPKKAGKGKVAGKRPGKGKRGKPKPGKGKLAAKNQAGKKRGVVATRSLPLVDNKASQYSTRSFSDDSSSEESSSDEEDAPKSNRSETRPGGGRAAPAARGITASKSLPMEVTKVNNVADEDEASSSSEESSDAEEDLLEPDTTTTRLPKKISYIPTDADNASLDDDEEADTIEQSRRIDVQTQSNRAGSEAKPNTLLHTESWSSDESSDEGKENVTGGSSKKDIVKHTKPDSPSKNETDTAKTEKLSVSDESPSSRNDENDGEQEEEEEHDDIASDEESVDIVKEEEQMKKNEPVPTTKTTAATAKKMNNGSEDDDIASDEESIDIVKEEEQMKKNEPVPTTKTVAATAKKTNNGSGASVTKYAGTNIRRTNSSGEMKAPLQRSKSGSLHGSKQISLQEMVHNLDSSSSSSEESVSSDEEDKKKKSMSKLPAKKKKTNQTQTKQKATAGVKKTEAGAARSTVAPKKAATTPSTTNAGVVARAKAKFLKQQAAAAAAAATASPNKKTGVADYDDAIRTQPLDLSSDILNRARINQQNTVPESPLINKIRRKAAAAGKTGPPPKPKSFELGQVGKLSYEKKASDMRKSNSGDNLSSASTMKKPVTKREVDRANLKRTNSNERRQTLQDRLKALGLKDDNDDEVEDTDSKNLPPKTSKTKKATTKKVSAAGTEGTKKKAAAGTKKVAAGTKKTNGASPKTTTETKTKKKATTTTNKATKATTTTTKKKAVK